MPSILSIDPGTHRAGVAWFAQADQLLAGWSARAPRGRRSKTGSLDAALRRADAIGVQIGALAAELGARPDLVIIEFPRKYVSGAASAYKSDDVLVVAAAAMAAYVNLRAVFPSVEIITRRPQEWKGQVPGDVMCLRILSKLDPVEAATIEDLNDDNIIDAVGIGLHALRRL